MWNHEELYQKIAAQLGDNAPTLMEKPVLAAEDFSFYQQYVPGLFFFLGTGNRRCHHPLSPYLRRGTWGISPECRRSGRCMHCM